MYTKLLTMPICRRFNQLDGLRISNSTVVPFNTFKHTCRPSENQLTNRLVEKPELSPRVRSVLVLKFDNEYVLGSNNDSIGLAPPGSFRIRKLEPRANLIRRAKKLLKMLLPGRFILNSLSFPTPAAFRLQGKRGRRAGKGPLQIANWNQLLIPGRKKDQRQKQQK